MNTFSAHGNESKVKDYTPSTRNTYNFESSASYNNRVKFNGCVVGMILVIVLIVAGFVLTHM